MWEFKVKSFGELTMFQYHDSNDMNDASFMQINPHYDNFLINKITKKKPCFW
jgi:hypothetical protein